MTNESGLKLKVPLIVYNCFQVSLSAYICKEVIVTAYLSKYKLTCSEIDDTQSELVLRVSYA